MELSLKLADGLVIIAVMRIWARAAGERASGRMYVLKQSITCPDHPESSLEELSPRLFSFNSPWGACSACSGLGTILEFDEDLIVPDHNLPVAEGAIEPFRRMGRRMNIYYSRLMRQFCRDF